MNCATNYSDLAAWVTHDLPVDAAESLRRHVEDCARCRSRVAALRESDAMLRCLPRSEPSAAIVLSVRRTLRTAAAALHRPDVMTLAEVADFLRLSPAEMAAVAADLPAFELGGQLRVRRNRLIEWVQEREQAYARETSLASLEWESQPAVMAGKGVS